MTILSKFSGLAGNFAINQPPIPIAGAHDITGMGGRLKQDAQQRAQKDGSDHAFSGDVFGYGQAAGLSFRRRGTAGLPAQTHGSAVPLSPNAWRRSWLPSAPGGP